MRSIWKHKWIVMPVAVAIILAAGAVAAVALADPGNSDSTTATTATTAITTSAPLVTATTTTPTAGATAPALALRQRRAALQQRLEQIKERWAKARAKMSPEDQAAFDQLLQKAKGQQQTVRQDLQDLAATLKQMRTLVQKVAPVTSTTVAPAN